MNIKCADKTEKPKFKEQSKVSYINKSTKKGCGSRVKQKPALRAQGWTGIGDLKPSAWLKVNLRVKEVAM